jgi:hypothetical protein
MTFSLNILPFIFVVLYFFGIASQKYCSKKKHVFKGKQKVLRKYFSLFRLYRLCFFPASLKVSCCLFHIFFFCRFYFVVKVIEFPSSMTITAKSDAFEYKFLTISDVRARWCLMGRCAALILSHNRTLRGPREKKKAFVIIKVNGFLGLLLFFLYISRESLFMNISIKRSF